MASVTNYPFETEYDIYSLTTQIESSSIVTALDHLEVSSGFTNIWFKDILSSEDTILLNEIISEYEVIVPPPRPPTEVVTQFEKRDKTIKLAHGEADVDSESGLVEILLKIPGIPGSADGRWISSGMAFFDVHTPGDKIFGVYFTDEDNILGGGFGELVGSYTDDDVDEINKGWVIPPSGLVKCETIGGYGFAPAGFYIKIVAKKAGPSPIGKFYCNFEWAKSE